MYACEIKYVGSNPLIKANGFGERPEPKKKKKNIISLYPTKFTLTFERKPNK